MITNDIKGIVVSFSISTIKNGYTLEYKSNSNKLTPFQKDLIINYKIGRRIYFENIKVKYNDKIYIAQSLNFKIYRKQP